VAALGKDASGKTTLAEILYGLRNPDSGSLLLDGASLTGLSLSDVRSDVSLVSGDPPFSGTLLENLELRRASVDPARVSSVLSLVGLTQDVNSLPHGAMTPIGPGGTHLTSSQSARLSLARAILSAPRLLVLDGVLDRIEQSAALQILAELRQLTSSTSILVLTSDPIIASAADHLVRLDGGQHEVTTE
jgi:putative ABC transport system ATP-binding protein